MKKGVAFYQAKVKSVVDYSVPHNDKRVCGFLGLTRYYQKFIVNYWKIAKSRTELVKLYACMYNRDVIKTNQDMLRPIYIMILLMTTHKDDFDDNNT